MFNIFPELDVFAVALINGDFFAALHFHKGVFIKGLQRICDFFRSRKFIETFRAVKFL